MNDEQDKTLAEIMEALKDKPDHTQVETDWGNFKELIAQARKDERKAVIEKIKALSTQEIYWSDDDAEFDITVPVVKKADVLAGLEKEEDE